MLSKILDKSTCASCKFCCSFRRKSLWEAPLFSPGAVSKLKGDFIPVKSNGADCFKLNLEKNYKTNDNEEEVPCTFLDKKSGCTLPDSLKPFDCKIWPFRVMHKNGKHYITLTPTCPEINKLNMDYINNFAGSDLKEKIKKYASENPFIIKEYKDGFPIICEI